MQHNVKKYLFDISESINSIEEFIGDNKDFNHYVSTKILRRAVERELEIIPSVVGIPANQFGDKKGRQRCQPWKKIDFQ